MLEWVYRWLGLSLICASLTKLSEAGGVHFQIFKGGPKSGDLYLFNIGRFYVEITEPGTMRADIYSLTLWSGIRFLWRWTDEEGYTMKLIGRWNYQEVEIGRRGP